MSHLESQPGGTCFSLSVSGYVEITQEIPDARFGGRDCGVPQQGADSGRTSPRSAAGVRDGAGGRTRDIAGDIRRGREARAGTVDRRGAGDGGGKLAADDGAFV